MIAKIILVFIFIIIFLCFIYYTSIIKNELYELKQQNKYILDELNKNKNKNKIVEGFAATTPLDDLAAINTLAQIAKSMNSDAGYTFPSNAVVNGTLKVKGDVIVDNTLTVKAMNIFDEINAIKDDIKTLNTKYNTNTSKISTLELKCKFINITESPDITKIPNITTFTSMVVINTPKFFSELGNSKTRYTDNVGLRILNGNWIEIASMANPDYLGWFYMYESTKLARKTGMLNKNNNKDTVFSELSHVTF